MFSLKVMKKQPAGLLLGMCAGRDQIVIPIYAPPHVSDNRMAAGKKTNVPQWI